jgi:hypothetical protein
MLPETAVAVESSPQPVRDESPLSGLIGALANAVRALHHQERRGDLANLRRMDCDAPVVPAFQRILVRTAPDADLDRARRIALFVKILSLPTSLAPFAGGRRRLGEVLAAEGIGEARVQMLMTARGPALDDLLLRMARRLVQAGTLPFEDIGRLILGDGPTIERVRFSVAKAYWTRRAADAPATSSPAVDTPAGDQP